MRPLLVLAVFAVHSLASSPFEYVRQLLNRATIDYKVSLPNGIATPARLGNNTQVDIAAARIIVNEALDQLDELNRARLAKPSRNQYSPRPDGSLAHTAEPLFKLTEELIATAALVAQIDVMSGSVGPNRTYGPPIRPRVNSAGAFWMQGMQRKGSWPWGKNPGGHTVRASPHPEINYPLKFTNF